MGNLLIHLCTSNQKSISNKKNKPRFILVTLSDYNLISTNLLSYKWDRGKRAEFSRNMAIFLHGRKILYEGTIFFRISSICQTELILFFYFVHELLFLNVFSIFGIFNKTDIFLPNTRIFQQFLMRNSFPSSPMRKIASTFSNFWRKYD